ncbi:MAG: protoheme IX farnesyltransferase [Limisphaerales bacterium]|jgi:protoheme IX farnesyltransferase
MSELVSQSATWRDFLEMCKPRVVLLMLLCAAVGMLLASSEMVSVSLLAATLFGIAAVASSAAVVNHLADAQIDARMARTAARPMATGRINFWHGALFSGVLGIIGSCVLWFAVNPLTAILNLASWVGYGLIYTLYLKRATPQNIVIGGLFGAAPPLFGWTAVTNQIDVEALVLVLIIFIWTPPHFWALALDRKEEYAAAEIPMLPVTHGEESTRRHILVYTILLLGCSLIPSFLGHAGWLYTLAASLLGLRFLYWAWILLRNENPSAALKTFRFSITYLGVLFASLLIDHYITLFSPAY